MKNIYILILRGINVSGQKKVPMSELKGLLEDLGLQRVSTYIQSGNVVFEYEKSAGTLLKKIDKSIEDHFGFHVPLILRTLNEMKEVVRKNPLSKKKLSDDYWHVTFLDEVPSRENLKKIENFKSEPDVWAWHNREIYVGCPNGYGRTKLTNTFFENKLKVTATTRNWRTVNQLITMGEALVG